MIPVWLQSNIQLFCKCGYIILNNDKLTIRTCSNPSCPYHLAEKADYVLKYLGIKGVGSKTLLGLIKSKKYLSHLDVLQDYFDEKPLVSLNEVAKLTMIYGHDKGFEEYCTSYSSFEQMFANEEYLPDFIEDNKEELLEAEKHFRVRPGFIGGVFNVMLTGEIHGYPARNMFIDDLNDKFGNIVYIKDVGRRKTGVDALIAEDDTPFHSKMAIAKEKGIPIITPAALVSLLEELCGGDTVADEDS